MTGSYPYEWGLAYVESKGEAGDSGLTGVKVRVQSSLDLRVCASVMAGAHNVVGMHHGRWEIFSPSTTLSRA